MLSSRTQSPRTKVPRQAVCCTECTTSASRDRKQCENTCFGHAKLRGFSAGAGVESAERSSGYVQRNSGSCSSFEQAAGKVRPGVAGNFPGRENSVSLAWKAESSPHRACGAR